MTTTTFSAKTAEGVEVTRSSKTMNYTHVVLVSHGQYMGQDYAAGQASNGGNNTTDAPVAGEGVWGWSQSRKGAEAMAQKAHKVNDRKGGTVRIVECTVSHVTGTRAAKVEVDAEAQRELALGEAEARADHEAAVTAEHDCTKAGTRMVKGLCQPCYHRANRAAKLAAKAAV